MKKTVLLALTAAAVALTATTGVVLAERGEHGDRGAHHQRGAGGDMRRGAMHGLMERYDTNGDRALTQEELDAARSAQFSEFDTDGDGTLTLAEYQGLWLDAMREQMVDRFQAHDDDGSGTVTAEEFNAAFDGFVARADRNGDGQIDADDRRRAMGRPERGDRPRSE